jgi:DNA-binding GntR family transcriptional regulator
MEPVPVHFGSLSEKAYVLIRDRILKGELPLGAPLSRRKLAAEFGMSFVPVSEALQRLEGEGLVESKPRVGTRVRVPGAQDLRNCYIVREALESQAARLFCEKASPSERNEILAMADRLERMIQTANGAEPERERQYAIQSLHLEFHLRIVECTGCTLLADLIEKNHVLLFNWFYDVAAGSKLAPGRHRSVAEVLVAGDPDAALLAMGRHVRAGRDEIEEGISGRFQALIGRAGANPAHRGPLPWRLTGKRATAALLPRT